MSRSKAQKRRRSRNNEMFIDVARKNGLLVALKTCDLRGVKQGSYNFAYRRQQAMEARLYAKRPSAFRPDYESVIHDRMAGYCEARQKTRKMAKPLVHVRAVTRYNRKVRAARRHYRAVLKGTGWTGDRVDSEFAKHFPSEWVFLQRDERR